MKAGTKYKHKDGQIYVLEHLPYSDGWILVTTTPDGRKRQWCEVNKTASGAFGNCDLAFEEYTPFDEAKDLLKEANEKLSNETFDSHNGPQQCYPELVKKIESFLNANDLSRL